MPNRIEGDVQITGTIYPNGMVIPTGTLTNAGVNAAAEIARSKLALTDEAYFEIPLVNWRIHDAIQTPLSGTAGTDDLGIISGTFGTASPSIQTSDAKTTSVTQRMRTTFILPPEYDDGETVAFSCVAGMFTTDTDGTATVDVEAYLLDEADATVGSDLVSTAATSIAGDTDPAELDFVITPATLTAGAVLDIRVTVAITDSSTGTAVIGRILKTGVKCDIRG